MAKVSPRLVKAQKLMAAKIRKGQKAERQQQRINAPTQFVGKKVPIYKPNSRDIKAASLANQYQREADLDQAAAQKTSQAFQNREFQGLSPQHRSRLQESANAALSRDLQNQDRALLGQQGVHGIRGGAATAQRSELARQGLQARANVQNELNTMDIDQSNKNRAAAYEIESGTAQQRLLGREQAQDVVSGNRQQKKENRYAKKANQLFSRI